MDIRSGTLNKIFIFETHLTIMKVVLDIESSNHLKRECNGDVTKLKIGIAGIKVLSKNEYYFFNETNIADIEGFLLEADEIIGYNLMSAGGLDYPMLKNYHIAVDLFKNKTYDLMELMIESFGHYSNFSLNNIITHTLRVEKKKYKQSNYKLIRNGKIEKVKENLKHELEIIEMLYLHLEDGGLLRFQTPGGLIEEHEVPFLMGYFPDENKELIENYDMPLTGMRLQIKEVFKDIVKCKKCHSNWRIQSICYFGDTMSEDVFCPNCKELLINVRTSFMGPDIKIGKV